MDKSGSRYRLRELIIDDRSLVSKSRKLTELSIGTLFWGLWALLWLPLLNLLAWLFGVALLSTTVAEVTDFGPQITLLLLAGVVVLLIFNWVVYAAYRNGKSLSDKTVVYYRADSTQTNDFFQFDRQDANRLKESQMLRFGFEEAEEMPSFVLMVDGKKVIKKQHKPKPTKK